MAPKITALSFAYSNPLLIVSSCASDIAKNNVTPLNTLFLISKYIVGTLIFLFIIKSNKFLSSNLTFVSSIISVFTFFAFHTYYSNSTIKLGSSWANLIWFQNLSEISFNFYVIV